MQIHRIGVMTPGDMGQAVAVQIQRRGYQVCTALDGRSARSRALAGEAGITDLGSIGRLFAECELVVSIMNPGAAESFAAQAARSLRDVAGERWLVDCNALAPQTKGRIAETIIGAGGRFLDAGIIGAPPRDGAKTVIYVSGPDAAMLEQLVGPQLGIVVVSDRIGDASALKMCSAALTKGTQALWLEVLIAARRLGIAELLEREVLSGARAPIHAWVSQQFPILPPKASRWVPEMHEIAATLEAAGVTPKIFQGVGALFAFVAQNPLAAASVESNRELARNGAEIVRLLAGAAARSDHRMEQAVSQHPRRPD